MTINKLIENITYNLDDLIREYKRFYSINYELEMNQLKSDRFQLYRCTNFDSSKSHVFVYWDNKLINEHLI